MSLSVPQCPDCKEPLNGRECGNCGCNPHEVETVQCLNCGNEEIKEEALSVQRSGGVGTVPRTEHKCRDCLNV